MITVIFIPILLFIIWWVFVKKMGKNPTLKPLVIVATVVLVLFELFEIWANFYAPQYIVKEIEGEEIYRTWNYDKALDVYHKERAKRHSSNIILFDEEWGNSLWDDE